MSEQFSQIHRNHNFADLRGNPKLHAAIHAMAAGELEHFRQAGKLRIYNKDQGAFGAAASAVLFSYVGAPFTAGMLRSALVASDLCSDGRAGAMISTMRRRHDLLLTPHQPAKGRTVELTPSPGLEAFVRNRMKVEVTAFAQMSPLARAALPLMDTDPQILKHVILYVGTQLYRALENVGSNDNVENFFAKRDFGVLLVALMILGCEDSLSGTPFPFSFSDAAARLSISRSHVRKLVIDGQETGLVEWRPDERQLRLKAVFIAELLQHHAIRFLLVAEALGQDDRLSGLPLAD